MRWEIEPSGCCERKGMRQIRFCFYLEPGDARHAEHHVKVDGTWQTNPFHNHFIRVPTDTTDEEIAKQANKLLPQFYGKWKRRERLGVTDGSY